MEKHLLVAKLDDVVRRIHEAGGRVVPKVGWFWTTLHYVVMVVTFGQNRSFLTDYYTTIGGVVGYPTEGSSRSLAERIAVLEHELIHIKQCARLGFGKVWIGFPIYMVLYLLLPLPIGLAYFRWRYEREAYAHGINVRVAIEPHRYNGLIEEAVTELTTGAYGWTWPFKGTVRAYFHRHCANPKKAAA